MCSHVCPLYHPSSFEIVQQPPRQFMNVNERGYKHLCNSAYVCVQSINPSLKIPPVHPAPPSSSQRLFCSATTLFTEQWLAVATATDSSLLFFFFFLPHRPRNEMSLLLGGGGPSANKYLCAVYIHIQVHEHTYDASRLFFASFKLCSSCFLRILRHNSQL